MAFFRNQASLIFVSFERLSISISVVVVDRFGWERKSRNATMPKLLDAQPEDYFLFLIKKIFGIVNDYAILG